MPPLLQEQLQLIDPVVVVTLGNFASRLLLETSEGIRRLRGRAYPMDSGAPGPHLPPGGGPALGRSRCWPRCGPTWCGPSSCWPEPGVTAPAGDPTAGWTVPWSSAGPADTRALAAALAAVCGPGDLVLLVGDLGAGKTTFAQGFARALGIAGPVTSPTFTLVRQYPVPGAGPVRLLLHADVYRLDSLAEVAELALPELAEEGAVVLVEWGDRAAPVLGESALVVTLQRVPAPPDPTGSAPPGAAGTLRPPGAPSPPRAVADEPEPRRVAVAGRGPGWAARRDAVAGALGALG